MSSRPYSLILRCFPREFRDRHAAAMAAQFDEQRRVTVGRPLARVALWLRAAVDAVRHGFALRFGAGGPSGRPSPLPNDARQAWRSVVARKGTTMTSIALLALALAVSATVFGVVDALLLRPAPFARPDQLFEIFTRELEGAAGQPYMPAAEARQWVARADLFAAAGGYEQGGVAAFGASSEDLATLGQVYATPGLFDAIGIRPLFGRTFMTGEGAPGNDHVAIISESAWRSRLGADPAAIGRTVWINGTPMTLIGVMPDAFTYPRLNIDLWRPFDLATAEPARRIQMVVRARGDLSRTMLKDRFASLSPGVMAASNRDPSDGRGWILRPLTENWIPSETRQSLWVLGAATALLLLTAAANLSSLTMAQIFGRTRQMAIQSALGASRARLVRQALAEQVFIGIAALALAAPVTVLAMRAARVLMPDTLTVWTMHVAGLDLRAAMVMVLVAIGTPVLAALAPAWLASRTSVLALLQQDSRSSMGSRHSRVLRQVMVVTEVTCAVVLLVTGALLVRSFVALTHVDRGFDSTRLMSVTIEFPARAFPSPLSRRLFVDRAAAQLRRTPGVVAVALASGVPPKWGQTSFGQIAIDGQPPTTRVRVAGEYVQPDFFRTTGIPVLAGRAFDETDDATHVIVSKSLAAAFWPGTSAVGHRFRLFEGPWFEIVGVAGDVRTRGLDDERTFAEYFPDVRPPVSALSADAAPTDKAFSGGASIVIRSNDVERLSPVIRATIASVDRRALIYEIAPVETLYAKTIAQPRMLLWLMVSFSVTGLLVATIGVYSVLSSVVAQQLREIGVRLMLGAEPAAMRRRVLRSGLALTLIGTIAGVVGAVAVSRFISSVLFNVRATDVASYVVVIVVVGAATIAAAWLPAHRAATADPAALLRDN
jgi:putative ABC transport system permease protein